MPRPCRPGTRFPRARQSPGPGISPVHTFEKSNSLIEPWPVDLLEPRPSMGSRFFCRGLSPGSASPVFARKHSTGSSPPSQVLPLNSPQSPQAGTWLGSSVGKLLFQSRALIFPDSRNRWICRAVYFMPGVWGVRGYISAGGGSLHYSGQVLGTVETRKEVLPPGRLVPEPSLIFLMRQPFQNKSNDLCPIAGN
jgi:hypothetical protein